MDHAKEAERVQPGRPLAVALDTVSGHLDMYTKTIKLIVTSQKGPEIRTGNTVGDADIPISEGTEINITTDEKYAAKCDDKNM